MIKRGNVTPKEKRILQKNNTKEYYVKWGLFMSKNCADLHIHSHYSDGTMSPAEIITMAKKNDVALIAITDHDLLEGSKELLEVANSYDIKCISGIELNTVEKDINFHILGYGINLYDKEFGTFVMRNRELLEEVNLKLIEKIEKDCSYISQQDYKDFEYNRNLGGWKALHYFKEKNLTNTILEGFGIYAKYNHTYTCVDFPTIEEACKQIHAAGGKAVLAHPGKVLKSENIDLFVGEVEKLIDYGLDGIECYYPYHSIEITEVCLRLCEKRNLLITSGSDCHGDFQFTQIGELHTLIEDLVLGDLLV